MRFKRCLCGLLWACFSLAQTDYTLFESGPVRPLALSPDGTRLFATNIPDGRLEIFAVADGELSHLNSIVVGLEPVAVAARSNTEVWVVNHLSDSISIVDLTNPDQPFVKRTLLVGDEPRDIVFAGPSGGRAFITCAHRGQNNPNDPQFLTPGVGRADVWVFDANQLGTSLGGDRLTIVTLFADTPRALAVSPDGSRVYAAAFHSGNQTTTLHEGLIPDGGQAAGGLPLPNANVDGVTGPETGLIVRFDGTKWADELGRDWSSSVRFNLPDKDVFTLDAMANPPIEVGTAFRGVGTILFNMAVNPANGKVYVTNTEASNEERFEGPGTLAGHTLRGRAHLSRITILQDGLSALPRHLNKHIDYSQCCEPIPNETNAKSLAQPMDMVFSEDGETLYVTAFGSSKVGIFDVAMLDSDAFVPDTASQIALSGGGPCGIVLSGNRLFVLTRFDNSISVLDTQTRQELSHHSLFNPEGEPILKGRRNLYDAAFTSSHGDQSCSSCHVFGDFDSLAWDLGNPDDSVSENLNPFRGPTVVNPDFHPMKGPMTTQSLRGMANQGPMHWRGDRTGSSDAGTSQPNSGAFDEEAAFKKFNPAFQGLIGRDSQLDEEDMQDFTDFVLQINYPPNPNRNLDNSLTTDQAAGRDFYMVEQSDAFGDCNSCHRLNPTANPNQPRPGFFGTDGNSSFELEPQTFKIAHLRNMYQKVGMFGMAATPFINPGNNNHMGDQVRGFGFMHDGSTDNLVRFLNSVVFNRGILNPGGIPGGAQGNTIRAQLNDFMMVYDSNQMPIIGQQTTLNSATSSAANPRVDLLIARANAGDCQLIAHGLINQEDRGFLYDGNGSFISDRALEPSISEASLRSLAQQSGATLTFTAVPLNNGSRLALDRDRDGYFNRDEKDQHSDPGDENSVPGLLENVLAFWQQMPLCSSDNATILDLLNYLNRTCIP